MTRSLGEDLKLVFSKIIVLTGGELPSSKALSTASRGTCGLLRWLLLSDCSGSPVRGICRAGFVVGELGRRGFSQALTAGGTMFSVLKHKD